MNAVRCLLVVLSVCSFARADSGGPYQGVPDLAPGEKRPVFATPGERHALGFYLSHFPHLEWEEESGEPAGYGWKSIEGYHASVRSLGYVRGHLVLEVRYTSDERIAQGLDHADVLLLLAKGPDTEPDSHLCKVIFYTSGGTAYNHIAEYTPKLHKYGAVLVTRYYSGSGAHRAVIGIRGTEAFGFERFSPEKAKEPEGERHPAQREEE